jgi:hypothetical protein
MLQLNLGPPDRLARQVRHPPLPHRIRLSAPNDRLPRPIRMKIKISNLQRHEISSSSQRFIGYAQHRPLPIRPQANTVPINSLISLYRMAIKAQQSYASDA